MDDPNPTESQFPADLQARLEAAGVHDNETLQQALAADPQLSADFVAFLQANPQMLATAAINALVQQFAQISDSQEMQTFWQQVPSELEEALVTAIEAIIAQAQAANDRDTVEHLSQRLAGFQAIQQAAQEQQAQEQAQPPATRAVMAFVQAVDDNAARAVFAQQRSLLQPFEAQQVMDALLAQLPTETPDEVNAHLRARHLLLRQLRGVVSQPPPAAPTPPATFDNRGVAVGGDLTQAERLYQFSAHAETGGTATVVNNLYVQTLERRWTTPIPPALDRDLVPRQAELAKINEELTKRGSVTITGRTQTVALQGAPGVGKSMLCQLLANQAYEAGHYPDGVIWESLGPDFTHPDQAQAVLRRWVGYATNFFELGDNLKRLFHFEPEAVRSLLAEHKKLLVVLDNVWSKAAIQPLQRALPPGVHLIVTTRLRELAHNLGAGWVEVGLLHEAEALALFDLRLGWQPDPSQANDAWAIHLLQRLGNHALGLDVALGVLRRYGEQPADWQPIAAELVAAIASGEVDRLHLGEDEPGHNVKAVIMYSYRVLTASDPQRLRWLGAFAAEAEFSTQLAATVWGCEQRTALETLTRFANAALLERRGQGIWRQHGLLRSFALALLRQADEAEAAALAHAQAYSAAMRSAESEQRYHELLPALPQLRHAFAWAVANDLELALDLAANAANLQRQFGLVRQAVEWAEQLLGAAQQRATPATLARVQVHRANILSDLATLPGEDRKARLFQALQAYDEALQFRRPDNAPLDYATTQNNRANILSDLATLPGEDRKARLFQALQAYDDALQFRRPDNAPLDYAQTQNNRATILSDLATLPGEDRKARLFQALQAYDEALQFIRPDNAPLAYATTQNNRANILSDLATLPGEDRKARLFQALQAYDDALQFRRPDNAPLDYATTQNNRATILSDLATLPGEDRKARLYQALQAYDDALQFRRPDNAPLDYATTQNNRANRLSDLATLPGEDRKARLFQALQAYDEALQFSRPDNAPLDYAQAQNNRATILSDLATLPGEDRKARLFQALQAYDEALQFRRTDNAPLDYAQTQNNRATILSDLATLPGEDRKARLTEALLCTYEAIQLFEQYQQAQYLEIGKRVLHDISQRCGDDFEAFWQELKIGKPPTWLVESATAQQIALSEPLLAALQTYQAHLQAANREEPEVSEWQSITQLGEALLAQESDAATVINWAAIREQLASDYNMLGNALEAAGDKAAALAAFERAIELQPDFAMWQRNRARSLIELGQLSAARVAIDQARALEPDAPRLVELEEELAKAQPRI